MKKYRVKVKYYYSKNNSRTRSNCTLLVYGKSENSILQKLKAMHRGYNIIIENYVWR